MELHRSLRAARRRVEDRPDALVVHRRAGRLSRRLRNARRGPKFAGMDQLISAVDNPLLEPWDTPFGAPPFDRIKPEHFAPAFEAALAQRRAEIAAIVADAAAPTFDNTIVALERAGALLRPGERGVLPPRRRGRRTTRSSASNATLRRCCRASATRSCSTTRCSPASTRSISARETLGLDAEAARTLERWRVAFARAGAGLDADKKARLAAIGERLASLGALFGQNVLADEKAFALVLDGPDDLAGLPESFVAAAAQAAASRGPRRQTRRDAVALVIRAVHAVLGSARPAREAVPRLRRARRWRRRARQCGDHARDRRAARRARAPARLFETSPPSASPTRWPRRRKRRSI